MSAARLSIVTPPEPAPDFAAMVGVSNTEMEKAAFILRHGSTELVQAVEAGRMTLDEAESRIDASRRGAAERPKPEPAPLPATLLLNKTDLSRELRRSPRSLERDMACGRLPKEIRVGGQPRWLRWQIELWLELGAPPQDEFEAHLAGQRERTRIKDKKGRTAR